MTTIFREHRTPAGLRVLIESNTDALSAAAGFFVATGSRHETPDVEGVSHFLEHMCFKATKKRDALSVSRVLDELGSRANAYTSWDRTVYYAQVLPEHLKSVIELLAEMIDPALSDEDFTTEKNVILEEIEMYNDRPEFLLFEALMAERFQGHALAGRILGTRDSITALTAPAMRAYHAARYRSANLVLAVAGRCDADEVCRWADALPAIGVAGDVAPGSAPVVRRGDARVHRAQDQLRHAVLAWPGPAWNDLRACYAASILGILFGDNEGSRLSWALTHPGVAESAGAGIMPFQDTGMFYVNWSAVPAQAARVESILATELELLKSNPPGDKEVERARTKFTARTILGAESAMSRMRGLGTEALQGLPYMALDEELALLLSITPDEVRAQAALLGEPDNRAVIGPLEEELE